jgi:hypothetical protein
MERLARWLHHQWHLVAAQPDDGEAEKVVTQPPLHGIVERQADRLLEPLACVPWKRLGPDILGARREDSAPSSRRAATYSSRLAADRRGRALLVDRSVMSGAPIVRYPMKRRSAVALLHDVILALHGHSPGM